MAVLVRSVPSEARIFLDGADTGKSTRAELTGISRAPHTIRLAKEFYADWNGPVPIPDAGTPAVIDAKLYAASYASTGMWGGPENDTFAGPSALAASRGNLVYVADAGPVKLRVWNADGESQAVGTGPELASIVRASGLALDPQGNIYVSDVEAHAIHKFDRAGQFVKSWGQFGAGMSGLNTPLGLAVDEPGNVLVADGGNGLVKRFSPEGALIDAFGQDGADASRLAFPRGVAVNSLGEVVVLDRAQVVIYGRDGRRMAAWGTEGSAEGELADPTGLAVDALDCVYVADSGNHRVQKFDPRGRFLCAWGAPGSDPMMMSDPCAIAVDARGAVYVAERNNRRVQIFTVGSAALGTPER
jgi:DNA-binding beta-propeller fold protein YncE